MKRYIYILLVAGIAFSSSCSRDLFETNPTNEMSEPVIFRDAGTAQTAMDGTYRSLYANVWGTGWQSEHPGLGGFTICNNLTGEDTVMFSSGDGWFWWDYVVGGIEGDAVDTRGRQFAHWEMFYTTISQCNFVIKNREMLEATPEGKSVLGQALALRGFMYLCLSENFCQGNYAVNKDTAPGVPVYTEPASLASDGNPRGKLVDVLSRAADDLDEAITVFDGAASQAHPSHIDRYTAYGLRARVAMVMGEWETVLTNANAALAKPGLTRVATVSDLGGNSDAGAKNVLWGFAVNAEDAAPFGGFLCYMDSENGNYASGGMQQLIDKRLYDLIPASDERKGAWWQGELDEDSDTYGVGLDVSYANKKFKFSNPATAEGDIINLRAEELILMAAEAECVNSQWQNAKNILTELGSKRDTDFSTRLAGRSNASTYNANTMAAPATLREEILFQRRIELWGEGMGRRFDLRRLHLGFTRVGSNHTASATVAYPAGDPQFVYLIPQKEFDDNKSLDSEADQNPR